MIDYKTIKKYIGKKIKIKYTKDFLIEQKKNRKKIEEENKLQDQSYDTQRLLKEKGLSSVNEIDFSEGVLTRIDIVSDYTTDEDYSVIIPSLSVQKLKYKCKVPLIQNFTLLFYLFFLLCTNLYHNNLILLILLFLFSILFLVIYLTLSFLHFLVIYNIHLLSWLLLRYS